MCSIVFHFFHQSAARVRRRSRLRCRPCLRRGVGAPLPETGYPKYGLRCEVGAIEGTRGIGRSGDNDAGDGCSAEVGGRIAELVGLLHAGRVDM